MALIMNGNAAKRDLRLDTLRGILLVVMTLNHLGTEVSRFTAQPFGFVSAAEGFILLSAYTYAITSRMEQVSFLSMLKTAGKRATKIYKYHIGVFLMLFTVAICIPVYGEYFGNRFFVGGDPANALLTFLGTFLLVHQPDYFDILPMYIVFLLISPLALYAFTVGREVLVLLGSVFLWILGWYYDPLHALADAMGMNGSDGLFNLFSWQLLWTLGLYLGFLHKFKRIPDVKIFPGLLISALVVIVCLFVRHSFVAVPENILLHFNKENIGPLRLINVIAQLVLLMALLRLIDREGSIGWPRLIGTYSLQVFSYHVLIIYLLKPIGWRFSANLGVAGDVALSILVVASLSLPVWLYRGMQTRKFAWKPL